MRYSQFHIIGNNAHTALSPLHIEYTVKKPVSEDFSFHRLSRCFFMKRQKNADCSAFFTYFRFRRLSERTKAVSVLFYEDGFLLPLRHFSVPRCFLANNQAKYPNLFSLLFLLFFFLISFLLFLLSHQRAYHGIIQEQPVLQPFRLNCSLHFAEYPALPADCLVPLRFVHRVRQVPLPQYFSPAYRFLLRLL